MDWILFLGRIRVENVLYHYLYSPMIFLWSWMLVRPWMDITATRATTAARWVSRFLYYEKKLYLIMGASRRAPKEKLLSMSIRARIRYWPYLDPCHLCRF